MRRLRQVIVGVAVVALLGFLIWSIATPGSVVSASYANGQMVHREAYAALIALVVLGMVALGIGFEDML